MPAEIREIDVYFAPSSQSPQGTMQIGLLGRLALQPALIEPFRNAATRSEIRSCMGKLFTLFADMQRQSKTRILESGLPRLWILTPTASKAILGGLNANSDEDNWGRGVYFLGDALKSVVIVIHQLPRTPDTLWLRILGRGRVREQAVRELEALPENNALRKKAIELLLSLKTTLEVREDLKKDKDERKLIMQLSPLYEQKLADVKQAERRTIIENLLKVRFGALDNELSSIVQPIALLSPEEFSPLLLQLSREDLLSRF
ncbi:hypothetical protein DSM106972_041520 [Dulcicalothrix desertica PCC 7102]|uniref:Flagellar assembly protein H n=1 Tax=Dulcicalothrix desertica PCC 7102 TaxID=232991 RepID=A0A433VEU2_9CYAN|nr:hypothetical protein [Dulcicalothrix desertica]RUT04583.1 hypothetical protein DSM106972_041520 [Dulcicalothrix desertica PCC 7102]TWH42592.1 hypothetical protein CAL7102_06263 [Dulcicalothrix desertica PCC 7102]